MNEKIIRNKISLRLISLAILQVFLWTGAGYPADNLRAPIGIEQKRAGEATGRLANYSPAKSQQELQAAKLLEQLREAPALPGGRLSEPMLDERAEILEIFKRVYRENREAKDKRAYLLDERAFDKIAIKVAHYMASASLQYSSKKVLESLGELILSEVSICMNRYKLTSKQLVKVILNISSDEIGRLMKQYPRFIVTPALKTTTPAEKAKEYHANYAKVLQHLEAKGIENARTFAGKSFMAADPIAKADKLVDTYNTIVNYIEGDGYPEVARTIASQAFLAGKESIKKAARFLNALEDLYLYTEERKIKENDAEWEMRKEVSHQIAQAAFAYPDYKANADRFWKQYFDIYNMVCSWGDQDIARQIAANAFKTTRYKFHAKKLYKNYKKVLEAFADSQGQECAKTIAGVVFASDSPVKDARDLLKIINTVEQHLVKKGYHKMARTIALNKRVFTADEPIKEADIVIQRYEEVYSYLTNYRPGEAEDAWQRREAIAGTIALSASVKQNSDYLELADNYVTRYESARQHVISKGYRNMANTIASIAYVAKDPVALAEEIISNYNKAVQYLRVKAEQEPGRLWVSKISPELLAIRAFYQQRDIIMVVDKYIGRFEEIVRHLEQKKPDLSVWIAQETFNRDGYIEEADRMLERYNKIVQLCRGRGMGKGAFDIASHFFKTTMPLSEIEKEIDTAIIFRIFKVMEGGKMQVRVDLRTLRLFHEAMLSQYQQLASLAKLSEREKKILELRSGIQEGGPYSLEEIGSMEDFRITRERIRQIETDGLNKINDYLRSLYPGWKPLSIENLTHRQVEVLGLSNKAKGALHEIIKIREKGKYDFANIGDAVRSLESYGDITAREIEEFFATPGQPGQDTDIQNELTGPRATAADLLRSAMMFGGQGMKERARDLADQVRPLAGLIIFGPVAPRSEMERRENKSRSAYIAAKSLGHDSSSAWLSQIGDIIASFKLNSYLAKKAGFKISSESIEERLDKIQRLRGDIAVKARELWKNRDGRERYKELEGLIEEAGIETSKIIDKMQEIIYDTQKQKPNLLAGVLESESKEKDKDRINSAFEGLEKLTIVFNDLSGFIKDRLSFIKGEDIRNIDTAFSEIDPELHRLHHIEIQRGELIIDVSELDANTRLTMSRHRFFSLINNLMENARKHNPDGYVSVKLKTMEDRSLEIIVKDDGKGIPGEYFRKMRTGLIKLFDLEEREEVAEDTEEEIQRRGKDTSVRIPLGMTEVWDIVGICNGTIQVSSKAEQGTTFTIKLPVKLASNHEALAMLQGERLRLLGIGTHTGSLLGVAKYALKPEGVLYIATDSKDHRLVVVNPAIKGQTVDVIGSVRKASICP